MRETKRRTIKRTISWLLILAMVFSVVSPGSVWQVNAQKTYDGYVYVTVERLTLGQGLADEPMKVGYNEEDSLEDILKRSFGEKMQFTDGQWGTYLSGYADGGEPKGWTLSKVPAKIREKVGETSLADSARRDSAMLLENDYVNYSGFTFAVDDTFPNVGMSGVVYDGNNAADTYHNGSVVRVQFSLSYGDLNISPSEYATPLIEFADKDGLIKSVVDFAGDKESDAYKAAMAVIEDWDASQEEADRAEEELRQLSLYEMAVDRNKQVVSYLKKQMLEPSYGGEWAILALARSGVKDVAWYRTYRDSVINALQTDAFNVSKATEYSRVIIALTAIGSDPAKLGEYNLTEPLADFDFVKKQGISSIVYALIALDCGNKEVPIAPEGKTQATRELLIEEILGRAVESGGWTFSGNAADPDMTGMAIQALAPYYQDNVRVKEKVDLALAALSGMQKDSGGFSSYGTESCESSAQVLCGLCALGIDAGNDSRFVKNGNSVLDAVLSFYDESTGGFRHTANGTVNGMASNQAAYALAAYIRMRTNRNGLYCMGDAGCLYICGKDEHIWDGGKVIKEAEKGKDGQIEYVCTLCGETKYTFFKWEEKPQNPEEPGSTEQPGPGVSVPGKTVISRVASPKKRQIKVTWKKKKGITGYQIQVSTSSKFKKSKTRVYKVGKWKTSSKRIKSLKSGRKYYVRIRTYKTVDVQGKKVTRYSKWSGKKKVRVK